MANIKSQIKRNRQNNKRRLRNRVYRGAARTAVKNARSAMSDGNAENTQIALREAIRQLDRAEAKGVLHKNNAARRKSRLMKAFAKMEPVPAQAASAPAVEEPVVEPKPAAKKASARAAAAKEPQAEAAPKAEPKAKAAAKPKADAAKKPAAKKPAAKTAKK